MLRLYDNKESRNGYKVVLLLNHLGTAYDRVEVDIFKGESRTPEFLARNPDCDGSNPEEMLKCEWDRRFITRECTNMFLIHFTP